MWNRNRQSLYGNKRVSHKGYSFGSKLEAAVFDLLQADPDTEVLQCQAQVKLTLAEIIYKPDFKCCDKRTGEIFYVEAKGFETPEWRIKRRLWMYYGPGRLEIYKGSHTRPKHFETVGLKGEAKADFTESSPDNEQD